MKRTTFLYLLLTSLLSVQAYAQEAKQDSLLSQAYPWIQQRLNFVQYHESAVLSAFIEKWTTPAEGNVTITHFGDSHVQPDIYSSELRKRLQLIRGEGGLGMMFPYSTAKTYSTINYNSRHTGEWRFAKSIEFIPKLPLGASGATCRTLEANASFTIEFKVPQPEHYRKLKIYCKRQKSSYDFNVRSGGHETSVSVLDEISLPYIEVELPAIGNSITIQLVKNQPYQTEFEFYGMSLESATTEGVIVHCLGIGGSKYNSLLHQVLLDGQLASLAADLIILDFGTNDYLYDNIIPSTLEVEIIRVIEKVRKASPNASILLTTTQDMNRRGINISAGEEFSALIRKVAKTHHCAFYDWYWISGGPEKMVKWLDSGLAQPDMIHLSLKGYTLKGRMLAEAIGSSLKFMEGLPRVDSLIFDMDSVRKSILSAGMPPDSAQMARLKKPVEPTTEIILHKIKNGETLRSIAKKYKVKVDAIKILNGLTSSKIVAGDTLKISRSRNNGNSSNVKTPVNSPQDLKKYVTHKVVKGETLSEIGEKYHVGLSQLKKLNKIKGSRIIEGQTLKIKLKTESKVGR